MARLDLDNCNKKTNLRKNYAELLFLIPMKCGLFNWSNWSFFLPQKTQSANTNFNKCFQMKWWKIKNYYFHLYLFLIPFRSVFWALYVCIVLTLLYFKKYVHVCIKLNSLLADNIKKKTCFGKSGNLQLANGRWRN